MKLCLIYIFAQHYRTSIFRLIDQEYDCDFFFGDSYLNVKKMDYSLLKRKVTEVPTRQFGGWSYRPGIQKLLRKDYDEFILLGETRSLSTWLFCIRARLFYPKKRVFFWTHGWYGKESRLERLLKKVLLKMPNGGVFLYGNYARELMIKEGFKPEKLYTIHNSLAYDEQVAIRKQLCAEPIYKEHFGNENSNLFFVGRLTTIKKLDMVLRAMAQLKENGQDYNMTFIGGGDVQGELEALAKDLGLQDNVWIYGPCYDEKILGNMIYNADLCVSPGNIGLTAMHSLVFGTPAITHNDFPHQMPEFEAQLDGATVKSSYNAVDVKSGWLILVQFSCPGNQNLPEIMIYAPILGLIDMSQSRTLNILNSARIEFGRECHQRCVNAAETNLVSKLSKTHHHKLVSAFEPDGMPVAIVSLYALVELISWYERHYLSEYGLSLIHDFCLLQYDLQKYKIKSRKIIFA